MTPDKALGRMVREAEKIERKLHGGGRDGPPYLVIPFKVGKQARQAWARHEREQRRKRPTLRRLIRRLNREQQSRQHQSEWERSKHFFAMEARP